MVRMRCRIGEDDPKPEALAKLQAALSEHLLDEEERRYVEPRLAQLLGLAESRESPERQDLFAAWRLFFERLAEMYPTVLVFEDMQWADASLLDFVEYLLEWSREKPLYVLTLARLELAEKRPTWGAGYRNFTSLYLEPLSESAMTELLQGLVPGLPASLQEQILARAEGVPLYAVETVRMLLDRGLLVEDGASYRVTGEVEALEVPETLHALVAARLDSLSGDERHLLQDASVLGKTFTPASLAALTGQAEAELGPLLAGLVRKELLGLQADPRSPEHGQYAFLQDIVRHVAYETLPKRDRRSKHLAAADHLSASFGDEAAEVVASHLLDAYRLDTDAPDAEPLKARARAALVAAGERAGSVAAASEAQRYFEQAAELTDDTPERAGLVDRAGQMALRAASFVEARSLFEQAHDAFEAIGETRAAGRVSARLAEIDFHEGHPPEAAARLEQALAVLAGGDEDADLAVVTGQLGRFLMFSGRDEEAASQLERALDLAETLVLPETLVQAMSSRAVLLLRRDRLFESRALLEAALELALTHNLHAAALRTYTNLAANMLYADLYADIYAVEERGLEHARRVGDRHWETVFASGGGFVLSFLGRWDEALGRFAEADQAAPGVRPRGLSRFGVFIHCDRGELTQAREVLSKAAAAVESEEAQDLAGYAMIEARLLRAEGKPVDAQAAAERALSISREQLGVTSGLFKHSLYEALETALERGDTTRAGELLATLAPLKPGQRTPLLRAIQAEFQARLGALQGDSHVEALFAAAEALYRQLHTPFHTSRVELYHAEWLIAQERTDQAQPLLATARETFEQLQAKPWLERLEAAEASTPAQAPA